jgi:ABC-2 type transport system ATP-binding protein
VGYVFGGDRGLYDRLSGLDNLRYFAELYAVPPREQRTRIGELLELVGLAGREKERVEGYSRGMRQRLHIARGLLHKPEVLFLDEPSIGIDPVGARELRQTVRTLVELGTTVLLTTHYMFEADELCHRIAVINGGQIVAGGTPDELKQRVSLGNIVEVEVFGLPDGTAERIRQLRGITAVTVEERGPAQVLLVHAEPGVEVTQPVLAELDNARVGRVATRSPTLEDAYIELVGA